jgi:hypothetical protein
MSFSDGRRRSAGTVQAAGGPKSKTTATFKRDGGTTSMQHSGATTGLIWRHQQNDDEQVTVWRGSMSELDAAGAAARRGDTHGVRRVGEQG